MKFYVPEFGETKPDARELPGYDCSSPGEYDAEEVAEWVYKHEDGWEAGWPLDIVLVNDAGEEHCFSVECEYAPTFSATKQEGGVR